MRNSAGDEVEFISNTFMRTQPMVLYEQLEPMHIIISNAQEADIILFYLFR